MAAVPAPSLRAAAANVDAHQDLAGKNVVVLGLGSSGKAAIRLALLRGAETVIAVDRNPKLASLKEDPVFGGCDMERVRLELGSHQAETLQSASEIVVSPGIPADQPTLAQAIASGVPTVSELAFAAEVFPKSIKIAAITGTNGKSTVTSFTGQILQQAGIRSFVGGNLGTPFSEAACQCLMLPPDHPPFRAAVLEVSSYQLELPGSFSPSVGVILNLTPDHLERHKSMTNYAKAKCRLFERMGPSDLSIIPHGDDFLRSIAFNSRNRGTKAWIGALPGVQVDSQTWKAVAMVPTTGTQADVYLETMTKIGLHNVHNAATASLLALALDVGVDQDKLQAAVGQLTLLPHRMQLVTEDKEGVLWINDSKATNVEASYAGINGLVDRKAIVLLGGLAKVLSKDGSLGFQRLAEALQHHKAIVIFGASGAKIEQELREANIRIPCIRTQRMTKAVQAAKELSGKGEVILLSPACASFDEFENFEHRGQVFQKLATKYS